MFTGHITVDEVQKLESNDSNIPELPKQKKAKRSNSGQGIVQIKKRR